MGGPGRFAIDQTTMTRLAAAAAVLVALAAAAWLWSPGAGAAGETAPLAPVGAVAGTMTVHVSGAVATPGLVQLPLGARVADAVAAAGGTLRSADLAALNLAAPVRDGEQVHIPAVTNEGAAASAADDGRIHLNRATAQELESLPGVGPVLAARIVAFRDEHGSFTAVEDLLDVAGIGEAKLAAMRDVVAVP